MEVVLGVGDFLIIFLEVCVAIFVMGYIPRRGA